jgi:hypothetical protein
MSDVLANARQRDFRAKGDACPEVKSKSLIGRGCSDQAEKVPKSRGNWVRGATDLYAARERYTVPGKGFRACMYMRAHFCQSF